MAIRICPKCYGKCTTTRNDCVHCGYVFEQRYKRCPECGERIDSTLKECSTCGYKFDGENQELEPTSESLFFDDYFDDEDTPIETSAIETEPIILEETKVKSKSIYDQTETKSSNEIDSKSNEANYVFKKSAYLINKTMTEDEFKRELLIALALKEDSPYDVVCSSIDITENSCEMYIGEFEVHTAVKCFVGNEKEAVYLGQGKKYVLKGEKYTLNGHSKTAMENGETLVDMQKKRYVTEWTPYSKSQVGTYKNYAYSNKNSNFDFSSLVLHLEQFQNKEIDFPVDYSKVAFKKIKDSCEEESKQSISIPGSKYKDKVYNCTSKLLSLECYKYPVYEARISYQEKEYNFYWLACDSIKPIIEDYPREKKNLVAHTQKEYLFLWKIITCFMFLLSFGLLFARFCWLWIVTLLFTIISIGVEMSNSEYSMQRIKQENMTKKKEKLNKALLDNKLKALTLEEEKLFDLKKDSSENTKKRKMTLSWVNIVYIILFIVLFVASMIIFFGNY